VFWGYPYFWKHPYVSVSEYFEGVEVVGDGQPKPNIQIILGLDYRQKWQDNKSYLQVIYDI